MARLWHLHDRVRDAILPHLLRFLIFDCRRAGLPLWLERAVFHLLLLPFSLSFFSFTVHLLHFLQALIV